MSPIRGPSDSPATSGGGLYDGVRKEKTVGQCPLFDIITVWRSWPQISMDVLPGRSSEGYHVD